MLKLKSPWGSFLSNVTVTGALPASKVTGSVPNHLGYSAAVVAQGRRERENFSCGNHSSCLNVEVRSFLRDSALGEGQLFWQRKQCEVQEQ